MFSAHGVSPAVVQAAADRELKAIDATCPLVTKVHREAVRVKLHEAYRTLLGAEPTQLEVLEGARRPAGHR